MNAIQVDPLALVLLNEPLYRLHYLPIDQIAVDTPKCSVCSLQSFLSIPECKQLSMSLVLQRRTCHVPASPPPSNTNKPEALEPFVGNL